MIVLNKKLLSKFKGKEFKIINLKEITGKREISQWYRERERERERELPESPHFLSFSRVFIENYSGFHPLRIWSLIFQRKCFD